MILQSSSPPPPISHQSPTKSLGDSGRRYFPQNRHRSHSHKEEKGDDCYGDEDAQYHRQEEPIDSYEQDDQFQQKNLQQHQSNKEKSCFERFSNYYQNNNNDMNKKMNNSHPNNTVRARRLSREDEKPQLNRIRTSSMDADNPQQLTRFENFDKNAVVTQSNDEQKDENKSNLDTENHRRGLSNIRPLKRRYTHEMRRNYEVTNSRASGNKIDADSPGNNVHHQKYIKLTPNGEYHRGSSGSSSDVFNNHTKDRHQEIVIPEHHNDIDYSNDTDHSNSPHSSNTASSVPQQPHNTTSGEILQHQNNTSNKIVEDARLPTERKVYDPNAKVGRGDTAEKVWLYEIGRAHV